MKEKLILVVEDDPMVSKLISRMLEANGASFIIAHNLKDAMELFEINKSNISYVLLDGNLTARQIGKPLPEEPETLPLAEEIARMKDFHGLVFPMTAVPYYVESLLNVLGNKGVFLGEECTKSDAILHVIGLIKR